MILKSIRRLGAGVALTALVGGLVILTAPPSGATALPAVTRASNVINGPDAGASDSALTGLTASAPTASPLAPDFDPGTLYYEVLDNDDTSATITPVLSGIGAAATVATGGINDPLVSGIATVPLVRGGNDITITVTSADTTATTVYHVTVWRQAAPAAQILSIADAHSTVYGGTLLTLTVTHGQYPSGCNPEVVIGDQPGFPISDTLDPASGLSQLPVYIPPAVNFAPGAVDLTLVDFCNPLNGGTVQAVTTVPDAVTYTAGYDVLTSTIPATVTSGSLIVVHGPDVSSYADVDYWMTDAQGNTATLDRWFTGNGTATLYPNYALGRGQNEAWYGGSGPRTFHVGTCPYTSGEQQEPAISACTSVFSKVFNWVAPIPTNVSFSPGSGPVAGGATIRLTGRFVLSGTSTTTIKVGAQTVPAASVTTVTEASDTEGFLAGIQGMDTVTFPAPPSATTGPVPITVTNDLGTTTARGTYTYSAQPTVTLVTPGTVANSGGSVITVHGTAFGSAGTPTVVIDGIKSPSVTRVSSTVLTAVVPASGDTGPVAVTVLSPQGGGISAPASLNLIDPTTLPTITELNPASGPVAAVVTLTGTGFGAAGTVGVSLGGQWALVTASSPTSITLQVPPAVTTGLQDIVVGATTGATTKAGAFNVLPAAGIATVTPATLPSWATGVADQVMLAGAGFGSTGTVKVGAAAPVAYSATGSGTQIAGVVVPTTAAGSLPIIVTPTGSTTPIRASVFVTAPAVSYAGPDPYNPAYSNGFNGEGFNGLVLTASTAGGTAMRIEGSGFGTSGTLDLGTTPVPTTTWTDTAITFSAPAHTAGTFGATVTPTGSTLLGAYSPAVQYVTPPVGPPTIAQIASVVDNAHGNRDEFDPANDVSGAFTLTGTNLAGTDPTATQVVISDGTNTFTVVPTAVTPTSLTFAAPRGFANGGWKNVQVLTNVGTYNMSNGMYYLNAGVSVNVSPYYGSCNQAPITGSGPETFQPADVTITNNAELFGDAGTVTMDGITITPVSYSDGSVEINMASLASALPVPWGPKKTIVITPSDTTLPAQDVGFDCAVPASVTTTANGSTSTLTVAAGTSYTLGYTTTGIIGDPGFSATAPGGYEYVSAGDFASTGFDDNVHAGVPVAAGDWYVRVALSQATYASADYWDLTAAPVAVDITGTPVTITPVSANGSTFAYKGQLGDGTDGSSSDFSYTATPTPADPITSVNWEYRDSICATNDPTAAWTAGLPKDVALSSTTCGGDGVTPSSWDVQVASFAMSTSGTDRSIAYEATLPPVTVTITPRNLTVAAVRADKVYDGTTAASLGDLTLTGVIAGDDVALANATGAGTFADATPGVNKPVTLGQPLTLGGTTAADYNLTNPSPTILGTITKAPATVALAASPSSVVLSQKVPVTITATVTNSLTNAPVDGTAAPAVLTSQTPSICTVTGTTVTALTAGTCVIAGTVPASTDYKAATAASDPTSSTETIDIPVLAAPQTISVIADNLTVAVGDDINPTSEFSGLFSSDSIDGLGYSYYSGATLLPGVPTDPGTYTVLPTGGTLSGNSANYTNPTAFVYVAGTLVITAVPPTITTIGPDSGPIAGGTSVTITGALLDTVTSIRIGAVTLQAGEFTVSPDGTSLTFVTPEVAVAGDVDLILADGTAVAADVFTYTAPVAPTATPPGAPTRLTAIGGDGTIHVTFMPPAADGGAAITSYQVSTDGGTTWRTVATVSGAGGTRTATVTGLADSTTYGVAVRAVNRIGAGPASNTAGARPSAPITSPGAPNHVSAVGHNRKIGVTFTPPSNTGGAPITSYQFSVNNGRSWRTVPTRAAAGGTRSATITGVDNGIWYPVKVRAVNGHGHGSPSGAHRALPNAPAIGKIARPPAGAIAVPKDPSSYTGPMKTTVDFDTSHNGTWAHPINTLGARQMTVGEAATLSQSSLFGFNSAVLTAQGRADVKALAGHLRLAHAISCEGYTDYAGEAAHEASLSEGRALAVCQALVQDGAHVVFATHGYGGARPVVVGGTAVARASNRRVVVLVTR